MTIFSLFSLAFDATRKIYYQILNKTFLLCIVLSVVDAIKWKKKKKRRNVTLTYVRRTLYGWSVLFDLMEQKWRRLRKQKKIKRYLTDVCDCRSHIAIDEDLNQFDSDDGGDGGDGGGDDIHKWTHRWLMRLSFLGVSVWPLAKWNSRSKSAVGGRERRERANVSIAAAYTNASIDAMSKSYAKICEWTPNPLKSPIVQLLLLSSSSLLVPRQFVSCKCSERAVLGVAQVN